MDRRRVRTAFLTLAMLLALPAAGFAATLYVRAGSLVEPETGRVERDRLIRIEDGRVAEVSTWRAPPAGAMVID